METGVRILEPAESLLGLRMNWSRLGLTNFIDLRPMADGSTRLSLTDEARSWMPDFDTLNLAQQRGLAVHADDDDMDREIWLTLLHSPVLVTFPSALELLSSVRIRRNITRNAARTMLNFNTTAIERPEDCWSYHHCRMPTMLSNHSLVAERWRFIMASITRSTSIQ